MADSVLKSILDQVQADVQSLALDGIASGNIQVIKVFNQVEEVLPTLPGVLVLPIDSESIARADGTNHRDDVGYPIAIGIVAADSDSQSADFDRNLLWRERIRKKFINQRLVNVPSVFTCLIEPRQIVDPFRWLSRNLWVSTLILRFMSREARS